MSSTALAIDIGGSRARAARIDSDGIVEAFGEVPLDSSLSRDEVVGRLFELTSRFGGAVASDVGLGIAVPAFIDAGRVAYCVNIPGLNDIDLAELLVPHAGVPVVSIPDVACAAVAEARAGTGVGVGRFLCAAVGTGVNAAMTVDGVVLETAFAALGDAGHVLVEPEGPDCPCGGVGCLEAVCSGAALELVGRSLGFASVPALVGAARTGDPGSLAALERAGRALGRAVATWSALLWPERVAVAGGVALAGDLILAPARAELARVGVPYITDRIELVAARFGQQATVIGAGLVMLGRVAA